MVDELLVEHEHGAESIVFYSEICGKRVVVKYRVGKSYRNSVFDKIFRYTRTRIEAKVLAELYVNGLYVPAPLLVDPYRYVIVMEYIDGEKFSTKIHSLAREKVCEYAYILGRQVGKMHSLDIYHGDLTLANIIIGKEDKPYIIDFGLAGYSRDIEEYAIDIHLLRRNLLALAPEYTDVFMDSFLKGYRETIEKDYESIIQRYNEIMLRGRYVDKKLKKMLMRERYVEK